MNAKPNAFLAIMSAMLIVCTVVLAAGYSKRVNPCGSYIIEFPADSEESDSEKKNRLTIEEDWNSFTGLASYGYSQPAAIIRMRDAKAALRNNKVSVPYPPPELNT